jgi:hypothetical protein
MTARVFIATLAAPASFNAVAAGYGWIRCQPGEKQFGCDVLITDLQVSLKQGVMGNGRGNATVSNKRKNHHFDCE